MSSTAVVSRFNPIVVAAANATHSRNSAAKFPRATIASRVATTSNTPATAVSSASTKIVARNSSSGSSRRTVAEASWAGSSPVATKATPVASRASVASQSAK